LALKAISAFVSVKLPESEEKLALLKKAMDEIIQQIIS